MVGGREYQKNKMTVTVLTSLPVRIFYSIMHLCQGERDNLFSGVTI